MMAKPKITKPTAKRKGKKAAAEPVINTKRPTRGMTLEMWQTFDTLDHTPEVEEAEALSKEYGWPKALTKSHLKQWLAAGGKKQVIPPPKPPKEKKERPLSKREAKRREMLERDNAIIAAAAKRAGEESLARAKLLPPPPPPSPPKRKGPAGVCLRCGGEEDLVSGRCRFCNHKDFRPLNKGEERPTRKVMAVGRYGWGVALLEEDALNMAVRYWPKEFPRKEHTIDLWSCSRGAYLMFGRIEDPEGAALIKTVRADTFETIVPTTPVATTKPKPKAKAKKGA